MVARLGQLSPPADQVSTTNPAWMWGGGGGGGGRRAGEDDGDDIWDRAFAEDTGNIMGSTWPPRSYTCTFCRREFRSAQALGGHMNVHRRDRAMMRQSPPSDLPPLPPATAAFSSPTSFPAQELVGNGGLCLLYPLPPHGAHVPLYSPQSPPSTLLSISPYGNGNVRTGYMSAPSLPLSFPLDRSLEDHLSSAPSNHKMVVQYQEPAVEELDLELRLGNTRS